MRLSHLLLISVVAIGGFTAQARADYFVWKDDKMGLSVSYPDTWGMASTKQPDDIFAVVPPTQSDDAVCRIRVREDKRFMIYPPNMAKDVQEVAVSQDFWDSYLNGFDNYELYGYTDGAGLGRGHGSFAVTGYDGNGYGEIGPRRGIAVASIYFGKIYIADCSAKAQAFAKWQPQFLSMIGSIDFAKAHHELWTGEYRNFFADPGLQFKWPGSPAYSRY